MRTLCAWCGQREKVGGVWGPIAAPVPADDERVSHGICPACEEAMMRENPGCSYGWVARAAATDAGIGVCGRRDARSGMRTITKQQSRLRSCNAGENPGVPHGTFARLRRAAVRRGASDPDGTRPVWSAR